MAKKSSATEQPSPYDLLIIGTGLTGLAAARRASQAKLSVALVGTTPGSLPYTSGALDLLGVYPTATKHFRLNPWEAVADLIEESPEHPYGRVGLLGVRDAWEDFAAFLEQSPLEYYHRQDENLLLITAAGTLKPTHLVPGSMKENALAWEQRPPTLMLGFNRLVDFSPEHVVAGLGRRWSGLSAARLDAQELMGDQRRTTPANLAMAFEDPAFRGRFVAAVKPLLRGAKSLGLPALLGLVDVMTAVRDLEQQLGVPVFEVPLLSPSLPGIRLADLLKRELIAAGVRLVQGTPITSLDLSGEGPVRAVRAGQDQEEILCARRVLLATGRFFGGGLEATRRGVCEPLTGMSVTSPGSRDDWHMPTFLGAPGHPINRVGLAADQRMRLLDERGQVLDERLRVAGAILREHDWVREKSGAGISVVTGSGAVAGLQKERAPEET